MCAQGTGDEGDGEAGEAGVGRRDEDGVGRIAEEDVICAECSVLDDHLLALILL